MKHIKELFSFTRLLLLTCLLQFTSCSDYLDKDSQVDTNLDYEQVFKDPHLAAGFLNNAYNQLPDGFSRLNGALLAAACDEAKHSDAGDNIQLFNNNSISPSYNPDNVWNDMYAGIRKCNIFLKELNGLIAKYNSIPEKDRPAYRGQALCLRAFFHFELLKRYQNIIYVDTVLNPFNEEEIYSFRQLSFKEAVEKIAKDCDDSAAGLLPDKWDDASKGRATRATAMAIKARMLLYAASPLNNQGNDRSLWEKAEEASKALYDARSAFGLGLSSDYAAVFTTPYDNEIIFATRASNRNDIETNNFPVSYQGKGYANPSHDLVNAYSMTGTYYDNPMNGYNPANPYYNREDRFRATILYNDATFKDSKVESYVGGKDGLYATSTATKTGYYLQKFLSPSISLEKGETARRPWILYRYAEVILNYAEARNEVLDNPNDKTLHDLLNLIRNRAKLRPFRNVNEYIKDKDAMREYIKHERRIELAMEEHRFWDLRRWKDAETVLNKPLQGMRIEKTSAGFTYTPFQVEQRSFDPKFYWYPIPRTEILKYKSHGTELKQNPGWE
ncbi:MAG: RagB/SusD family nutrient uptake outer membrane protein [Dysgonamonadaceae bacterium]|jgi:hypothetical protein|nr:RagB/SusD family nutrient uptake outer membrane protein [Dysgonamonadaceae bacterium]